MEVVVRGCCCCSCSASEAASTGFGSEATALSWEFHSLIHFQKGPVLVACVGFRIDEIYREKKV